MDPGPSDPENVAASITVHVRRTCDGSRRTVDHRSRPGMVGLRLVDCQQVCSGHVVGVRRVGRVVWFERVDSDERRRALGSAAELATGPTPPPV